MNKVESKCLAPDVPWGAFVPGFGWLVESEVESTDLERMEFVNKNGEIESFTLSVHEQLFYILEK